jgi:putative transposase
MAKSGYRIKIKLADDEMQVIIRLAIAQGNLFNSKVAETRYFRHQATKVLQFVGQMPETDNQYSHLTCFPESKTRYPCYQDLPMNAVGRVLDKWRAAEEAFKKGIAKQPRFKKLTEMNSVILASGCFYWQKIDDEWFGVVGSKKRPVCRFSIGKQDDTFKPSSVVNLKIYANNCYCCFAADDGIELLSEQDKIDYYSHLTTDELSEITLGGDRGVVITLATSDSNLIYQKTAKETKQEKKAARYLSSCDRRISKQTKGSRKHKKFTKRKQQLNKKLSNRRKDFNHKTSKQIADSNYEVVVLEDLKVQNMTKKAKPKKDTSGNYIRNNKKQKSGLNKAILRNNWGQLKDFLTYKLAKQNKLLIFVNPKHTSQECSSCGCISKANRKSQSEFRCTSCGLEINADINAANVIKNRGIRLLRAGEIEVKKPKSIAIRRKKTSREPVLPELNLVQNASLDPSFSNDIAITHEEASSL